MKFMNESIAELRAFKEAVKERGQDADLSTNRDESSTFDNVKEAFDPGAEAELDSLGTEPSLDEPSPDLDLGGEGDDIVGDEVSVSLPRNLWDAILSSIDSAGGNPDVDEAISSIEQALAGPADDDLDFGGDDLMDEPEDDFGADLGDDLALEPEEEL